MQQTKELSIIELIENAENAGRTDALDLSFAELASMYPEELEINPEYQRYFRWSQTQQSQFIESLLVGLPVPAIFFVETQSRQYELIDGLQRISSFLHFMGMLKTEDGEYTPKKNFLKLINCEIVPELNGMTYNELPVPLRMKLRRSYVRVQIIRKNTEPRLKYDMFKRLNTGGSFLSAQEVRNSTIRLLDETFINTINNLSENENFQNCLSYLQDEQKEYQFDKELILRFFTLKNAHLSTDKEYNGTLADYMTIYAERVAFGDNNSITSPKYQTKINFDYKNEKQKFEKTFLLINESLGKDAFCGLKKEKSQEQFLSFYYEAITIAVAYHANKIEDDKISIEKLKNCLNLLKQNPDFLLATNNAKEKRTSGSKYVKYMQERIELAKNAIKKEFNL